MVSYLLPNVPAGSHRVCATTVVELGISLLSALHARSVLYREQLATLSVRKKENRQELLKLSQRVREKPSLQLY
jgi:hypothetical protein